MFYSWFKVRNGSLSVDKVIFVRNQNFISVTAVTSSCLNNWECCWPDRCLKNTAATVERNTQKIISQFVSGQCSKSSLWQTRKRDTKVYFWCQVNMEPLKTGVLEENNWFNVIKHLCIDFGTHGPNVSMNRREGTESELFEIQFIKSKFNTQIPGYTDCSSLPTVPELLIAGLLNITCLWLTDKTTDLISSCQ